MSTDWLCGTGPAEVVPVAVTRARTDSTGSPAASETHTHTTCSRADAVGVIAVAILTRARANSAYRSVGMGMRTACSRSAPVRPTKVTISIRAHSGGGVVPRRT